MKTHVSYNGCLYKIAKVVASVNELPAGSVLVGYGKHINPKGSYMDAKIVSLFQTPDGWYIIK